MKREFTSLTPQEALHVAIFIEERNAELYQQFAELFAEFKDPDSLEIAQVFWDMATEERSHGTMLQERYFERYGTQACVVTEEDICELLEVPKLESGELFAVSRGHASIAPRTAALRVALDAEQTALRYYSQLVEKTPDRNLRSMYAELANFEADHTEFLRRKLNDARRAVSGGDVV
ncbi:MAG: ferritin family protein [Acidobacteriia bacterium]|nr:ferritin family protein [Terriglobia bacterium]